MKKVALRHLRITEAFVIILYFLSSFLDLGRYGGVGLPPKYDDIVKGSAPNQTKSSDKKRDQTDSELMESFQKPPTYISVAHLNQK